MAASSSCSKGMLAELFPESLKMLFPLLIPLEAERRYSPKRYPPMKVKEASACGFFVNLAASSSAAVSNLRQKTFSARFTSLVKMQWPGPLPSRRKESATQVRRCRLVSSEIWAAMVTAGEGLGTSPITSDWKYCLSMAEALNVCFVANLLEQQQQQHLIKQDRSCTLSNSS